MRKAIPCLYASYGRYIDAYRAIPSNIDGLKISLRRSLLALYDITKTGKFSKSAKVTGHIIGNYHPHGDASAYDTIFTLVLQEYAIGHGGWGAKDAHGLDNPSAQRYTEVKIAPWVKELAFKYIDYVPWENLELNDEPLYLPCPIPIGLIGIDNILGIGFHRTLIPKFVKSDLAKRLLWLINNYEKYSKNNKIDNFANINDLTEEEFGPIIKPNFRDCKIKENDINGFYNLLYHGTGNFRIIPNGSISNNRIYINGRVPSNTFKTLFKDIDSNKLDCSMIDLSSNGDDPYRLNVELTFKKKTTNQEMKDLFVHIWTKYLIKNINYKCYFVNNDHVPELYGIDYMLINNYNHYTKAVLNYRVKTFHKSNYSLFTNSIILIIKDLIIKFDVKSIDDLINGYKFDYPTFKKIRLEKFEDNKFVTYEKEIDVNELTEICNKNSIMKLINVKIDINKINQDIIEKKKDINNIYQDCQNEVDKIITKS